MTTNILAIGIPLVLKPDNHFTTLTGLVMVADLIDALPYTAQSVNVFLHERTNGRRRITCRQISKHLCTFSICNTEMVPNNKPQKQQQNVAVQI